MAIQVVNANVIIIVISCETTGDHISLCFTTVFTLPTDYNNGLAKARVMRPEYECTKVQNPRHSYPHKAKKEAAASLLLKPFCFSAKKKRPGCRVRG